MPQLNHQVMTRPLKSVVSASWLYPFKGIYFFVTNRAFWPLLGRHLIPLSFVSIIVFGFLFTFAYFPQVAFLALFGHGPGAFVNAAFLVLGEGAVIIALLFEALLVDETLVDVFDAVIHPFPLSSKVIDQLQVLIKQGLEHLVSPTRILDHDAPNPVKMLGRPTTSTVYSPFSFRQILEFILFLPLNFIPYVGTPAFLVVTGARAGPFAHWRYFKLRGLTKKERNAEIRQRRWKYTWYVGFLVEMALRANLTQVWNCCFVIAVGPSVVDGISINISSWICAVGSEAGRAAAY